MKVLFSSLLKNLNRMPAPIPTIPNKKSCLYFPKSSSEFAFVFLMIAMNDRKP